MKGTDNEFWVILKEAVGGVFLIVIIIFCVCCTGCKILKNQKVNTKDSVSTSKTNEGNSRIDSSGTKTDKTNTKETVYYPQPIYIQGKDGETRTVFVPQYVKESGTEKIEQAQIIKDTSWKEAFNSLAVLIANKETQTKTKIGFSTFEIIVIIIGGLMFLKMFGMPLISLIKR